MKKVLARTRNMVLGNITGQLQDARDEIKRLDIKIGEAEAALRDTHLQINHATSQYLTEINGRTKNSGFMPVSDTEIVTKIFSGLKMYVDPRDIAVVPHLVLDSIWEHRITAAWLKVVRSTDTVIDIGANFGYFGVLAAQLTDKKQSKVVMFEANPHLIPYIKKTMAVNWLNEQSVVENLAIADKPSKVTLNLLKDYIGSSSIQTAEELSTYMDKKMYLETIEKIEVDAVSLDDYCQAQGITTVDLIKMDIEGYEEIAYQGMRKIVAASPEVTLFVEFTKDGYKTPKKFYERMLKDFGYVYIITDDGAIARPATTAYEDVVGEADDWVMPIFSKRANLIEELAR